MRPPRKPRKPHVGTMSTVLSEALRNAHDTWSNVETDNNRRKDKKFKKNKWEINRKESRWQ